MRIVEEGIADPEDVDLACVKAFNHAMGPLDTMDFSGLDTTLRVADNLRAQYGERFLAPRTCARSSTPATSAASPAAASAPRASRRSCGRRRDGRRCDGVATVTVDNPPVNALDDPTLAGLGDAAREPAADRDDVRAVVLTGAGASGRSWPARTCARSSTRSARPGWRRTSR